MQESVSIFQTFLFCFIREMTFTGRVSGLRGGSQPQSDDMLPAQRGDPPEIHIRMVKSLKLVMVFFCVSQSLARLTKKPGPKHGALPNFRTVR